MAAREPGIEIGSAFVLMILLFTIGLVFGYFLGHEDATSDFRRQATATFQRVP